LKKSAGLLLYRFQPELQVFLVHPGGPFWKNKDAGAWSIPKGEFENENALDAAKREFEEETGAAIDGEFIRLPEVKLKSGKVVLAFAIQKDFALENLKSNTIYIDWPPRSGRKMEIPEVDDWKWFEIKTAREKINPGQFPLLDYLLKII
jgi:predicted NUDIX family NTP pyrophosphohydrolase